MFDIAASGLSREARAVAVGLGSQAQVDVAASAFAAAASASGEAGALLLRECTEGAAWETGYTQQPVDGTPLTATAGWEGAAMRARARTALELLIMLRLCTLTHFASGLAHFSILSEMVHMSLCMTVMCRGT